LVLKVVLLLRQCTASKTILSNMKPYMFLLMFLKSYIAFGQSDFPYQLPHKDILDLADVKPAPSVRISYDGKKAVLSYRNNYKSIEELCEQEVRLAGMRINPVLNVSSRMTYLTDLKILDIQSGKETPVAGLPAKARLAHLVWAPDHSKMALTNTTDTGVELWVLDIKEAKARKLTEAHLNANQGTPYVWMKDGSALLCMKVPADRKPLYDTDATIPTGPVISENEGQKAQNRTYQDLLQNPLDEFNFEQLMRSEIHKVDLTGKSRLFLKADMWRGLSFSPDGNYLMVSRMKKPFSYLVPASRFPMEIAVYDTQAKQIKILADIPLTEELPKGFMAVRRGPRQFEWRADENAVVAYVEALDDGDPAKETEYRDAVFQWKAPFTEKPDLLVKTKYRYSGITWGRSDLAIVYENWWNTRTIRTLFFNPSQPDTAPRLFNERNSQDKYADPGIFVTERNDRGTYTLAIEDGSAFMIGDGYRPEGKFPFVDRYDLQTFDKERIYESKEKDRLEDIISALDVKQRLFLTRLESKNEYPDLYIRDLKNDKISRVTMNENPFKVLNEVHKEVIRYRRDDGVELSATLYLPVGYDKEKKEKMPMIMWAYPTEFKDKNSAGQVTANANEFTFPGYGSPLFWLNRGYVVLDDAAFPIVGEGDKEPNDTFIPQLVANAKAAIDAVDAMGYIDRNRVAVGGHSYGAFMTANLLTHSNLFAAGIARSGAYNRTLTPFGFQSEERNYWEAPQVYNDMSPFQHADKMKTPILLIHGEADNNSGTFPMQSERYFNALKGLGATARLVILPKESHGYAARESIMHMLWEQDQWLEKHVKNKKTEIQP
jgi:dipeptidyl aminopeptidase/acylaminoacyl peptidase